MQSVTRNGKSIMLTMLLALIVIYLFSLVGFVFFRDDFYTNIQTQKNFLRYRRSNHLIKTMTVTRMSKLVVVRDCLLHCFLTPTDFN